MSRSLKAILGVLVVAIVVVVLFTTVFPWVEERLENPTIGSAGSEVATSGAMAAGQVGRSPR